MTTAWALHILILLVIGAGWTVGLVVIVGRGDGPPWWAFVIAAGVFAFLGYIVVGTMARRVEVTDDEVIATTAFGVRRARLSEVARPGRLVGSRMQPNRIHTVRYPGGTFTVPGYSSGAELMRDLRSVAEAR